jgi:hypothetical protein
MGNFTCKGCEKRHVGCHSTCEKYKAESEKDKRMKAEAAKFYKEQRDANTYEKCRAIKIARKNSRDGK